MRRIIGPMMSGGRASREVLEPTVEDVVDPSPQP